MEQLSLSELSQIIQQAIKVSLDDFYWVKAEIVQIKDNYSGHCYLELIEKTPLGDKIIAQSKAMIWANTYRILKPYFHTSTKKNLCAGMKILVRVKIDYHPVFGLSLVIFDIDPTYTVGDLALRKAEIIRQLKEDGIFDMNRELETPMVPQRIAIISSESAAGYLDFITHLQNNPYNYHFDLTLYPAFMQGEKAEASIIEALNSIFENNYNFDMVAIIRGGGSQTDLSCFDGYEITSHVAQFPLPVITGIGHEQDDSITDLVACLRMKTPTAAAAYLINCLFEFESLLQEKTTWATGYFKLFIEEQKDLLENTLDSVPAFVNSKILNERLFLGKLLQNLAKISDKKIDNERFKNSFILQKAENQLRNTLKSKELSIQYNLLKLKKSINENIRFQNSQLQHLEQLARLSHPELILKKGFSITLLNGKPVTTANQVQTGDILTSRFYEGEKKSEVLPDQEN